MIRTSNHIDKEKLNGFGGSEIAAKTALLNSGKFIPRQIVTISRSLSEIGVDTCKQTVSELLKHCVAVVRGLISKLYIHRCD